MTRIHSRLKKLEALSTDHHGLIPHSPRWLAHWAGELAKLAAGDETTERIPLEAWDALVNRVEEQNTAVEAAQ
jgi:hypothetical protein